MGSWGKHGEHAHAGDGFHRAGERHEAKAHASMQLAVQDQHEAVAHAGQQRANSPQENARLRERRQHEQHEGERCANAERHVGRTVLKKAEARLAPRDQGHDAKSSHGARDREHEPAVVSAQKRVRARR